MIRAIFAICSAHASVACLSAGTLYTTYAKSVGDMTSVLATVDPITGQATPVGETAGERISGLTWDPTSEALFGIGRWNSGVFGRMLRIDPLTGETTTVSDTVIAQPSAMTWVPTLGRFVVSSSGQDGSTFYAINHAGVVETIGHVDYNILGMTYDPVGDRILTSLGLFPGGETGLGEFDVQTGAASVFGLNGAHLQGIALDPDTGVLYGLPDLTETPGGGGRTLFTVDMETGVATPIATLEREEFYASLAVIPVPAPAAALVFLPLAVRRRR